MCIKMKKKKKRKWKWIKGYKGLYRISRTGKIKSYHKGFKGKILVQAENLQGYKIIGLYKNGRGKTFSVHRLVLETFVGSCPEGMQACHNDGDKTNNKVSNLRWDTPRNNSKDRVLHGTQAKGEIIGTSILTDEEVLEIRELYATKEFSITKLATIYEVGKSTIRYIINGTYWAHVGGPTIERKRTITEEDVYNIRVKRAEGIKVRELANEYNVDNATISYIVRGATWKHVGGPITKKRKFTEKEIIKIRKLIAKGIKTCKEVADKYGVTSAAVNAISKGKTYTYFGGPITKKKRNKTKLKLVK